MAKAAPDATLDKIGNYLATGNQMTVCSAQPTTRAEAITTYMLGSTAMTPATDYTLAAGDSSGRKCTMAAKNGASVTNSGTATHVALVDGTSLLFVTTCTSQALTAGNTVNFPAWKVEVGAPT